MAFFTRILRCAGRVDVHGHTDNLERRVAAHRRGLIPGYTQTRRPVALAWCEEFSTREEALAAERQIKSWTRAKKEALIAGDIPLLRRLAIPVRERHRRAPREWPD